MEPPEICPPWWPDLLWWLLHRPPKPWPGPPPEEEEWRKLREPVEGLLTALNVYAQAQVSFSAKERELRGQVQQAALEQIQGAVERLTEIQAEG